MLAYSRPEMAFYMRRAGAFTLVAEAKEAPGDSQKKRSGGVGEETQGILGFILTELQRRKGHVITIDVIGAARRLGVGSAMLDVAEARLRESGAEAVALEVAVNNEAAIRFYKEKGYFVEKTVRGYYSNQLDALVMEKALVAEE